VEWVDDTLGPLLSRFSGANTLVCSDHGDAWGEDGMWEHGIHHPKVMDVPLVFRLQHAPVSMASRAAKVRGFARKILKK
jgi:glucan phosphoethanolaminetransferase (alkaline phosphatase superfamily)